MLLAIALGDIPYTGFLYFVGKSPAFDAGRLFVRPLAARLHPSPMHSFTRCMEKRLLYYASGDAWFGRLCGCNVGKHYASIVPINKKCLYDSVKAHAKNQPRKMT